MGNGSCAFKPEEYDDKIRQTLPYYEEFYKQVIDIVKIYNPGALTWLDVGCGTGKMAREALKEMDIEKFVFCDCSEEMVQMARKDFGLHNAEFLVSAVQNIDFHNQFDVVTAIQVNHYLQRDERAAAVGRMYEALKKDGILISFENFAPNSPIGERLYLDRWKSYQLSMGRGLEQCERHIGRYNKEYFPITLSEHLELMKECGFRAAEVLWVSYMQAGLLGIK